MQRRWRSFIGLEATKIVPEAVTWPYSVDGNGRSYPGGTVGVRMRVTSAKETSYDNEFIYPVPSTLPAGYTLRPNRDWIWNPQGGLLGEGIYGGGGGSLPPHTYPGFDLTPAIGANLAGRIRTADGLTPYAWTPGEVLGDDCFINGDPGNAITPPSGSRTTGPWYTEGPTAGFRYFRCQTEFFAWPDPIGLELRVMNDGGNNGGDATTRWDTLLKSWTWAASGVGVSYDTGYYTGSELQMALNDRRYIQAFTYRTHGGVDLWMTTTWYYNIGQRCDIPFPFSVPGSAETPTLFAPGGIVAGAVPGY